MINRNRRRLYRFLSLMLVVLLSAYDMNLSVLAQSFQESLEESFEAGNIEGEIYESFTGTLDGDDLDGTDVEVDSGTYDGWDTVSDGDAMITLAAPFTPQTKPLVTPKGYRPYLEWMNSTTAGIKRLQKIYVYANAGEKVYFGSSAQKNLTSTEVTNSLKDSFGYSVGTCVDACMAVTLPYDSKMCGEASNVKYAYRKKLNDLDGIANSKYGDTNIYLFQRTSTNPSAGYIKDWKQEYFGPDECYEGGYDAYSFVAPVTGIYTFRFFGSVYKAQNPTPVAMTGNFIEATGGTVAAWDVTVANNGEEQTGRAFTDVLFWNMGGEMTSNQLWLNQTTYVLTSDGFEYSVNFRDTDPWGFVFYANKRGLLVANSEDGQNDGEHYRSLMRSVFSKEKNLYDITSNMGVYLNMIPTNKDDDESYYIFFEEANEEVIKWYTGQKDLTTNIAANHENIKNFNFYGFNSNSYNTGIEGLGGYFGFDYVIPQDEEGVHPTSFEIVLDFSNNQDLMKKYGYSPGLHNEVVLSNTLEPGANKIYWDGKDEYGNIVPQSDKLYDVVSLYAKAGEIHFPLLDVEGNVGGITIQMLNENILDNADSAYNISYNNSVSSLYTYNKKIADDADYSLFPVNSKNGAMKYRYVKSNSSIPNGDQTILDVWTNYRMEDSLYTGSIRISNLDDTTITAATKWQYYYEQDNLKHFDSSVTLPQYSDVILQYRIIDSTIGDEPVVNPANHNWQVQDHDIWQNYNGEVIVDINIPVEDSKYRIVDKKIQLSDQATNTYNALEEDNQSTYHYIRIPNYIFDKNKGPDSINYPYYTGEGLCQFFGLPTQVKENGVLVDKYYQYRVVDKRVLETANPVLETYAHEQSFSESQKLEIQLSNLNVLNKELYYKETLFYEYEPDVFDLPILQKWDDLQMDDAWVTEHRPKAVQVAILYGVPKQSDTSQQGWYDITEETDYLGVNQNVIWRKIQQIQYLVLRDDGSCVDEKGKPYNIGRIEDEDVAFGGYYPVWKYTSDGYPYFYRVVPIGYSMDGKTFVTAEDIYIDKNIVPEYYALTDYHPVQYDEALHPTLYGQLYEETIAITDSPAYGEILFEKRDEKNRVITGKTATYEMFNQLGQQIYFSKLPDGRYRYEGIEKEQPNGYTNLSRINTDPVDGCMSITNLPIAEYKMVEIISPDGYGLEQTPIPIWATDFIDTGQSDHLLEVFQANIYQNDTAIYILPETGGIGTGPYQFGGLIFILFAILAYLKQNVYFKRKERKINMKKMNKVLSMFLAFLMILATVVTSVQMNVLAEDGWEEITTDPSITIVNTSENHTYSAYQIFVGQLARSQRKVPAFNDTSSDPEVYPEYAIGTGSNEIHIYLKGGKYYRVSDGTEFTESTSAATPVYEQALRSIVWGDGITDAGIVALYRKYVSASTAMPTLAEAQAAGYDTVREYLDEVLPAEKIAQKIRGTEENGAIEFANFIAAGDSNGAYLDHVSAVATGNGGKAVLELDKQGYYLVTEAAANNTNVPNSSSEVIAYSRYIVRVAGTTVLEPKASTPKVIKKVYDNRALTGITGENTNEDAMIPGFKLDTGSKAAVTLSSMTYPAHADGANGGWNDVADYSVGDTVPFKIIGTLPSTYTGYSSYKYILHDTLAKGFTPVSGTLQVYVLNDETRTNITASNVTGTGNCYWESVKNDDGTTSLNITIVNTKLYDATGAANATVPAQQLINENSKIVIEYAAKLNLDANMGTVGNENGVYLEFSNDPNPTNADTTSNTPLNEAVVFTYLVNGTKIAAQQQSQQNLTLAGAEFKLRRESGEWYCLTETTNATTGVVTKVVNWVEKEEDASVVISNGSGHFEFKGLDDDIYYLKEVVAPYGYVLPTNEFKFEIHSDIDNSQSYNGTPSSVWANGKKVTAITEGAYQTQFSATVDSNQNVNLVVTNSEQSQLPTTGGMGTTLIYAVGILLMIGAIVLLLIKRKSEMK